MMEYALEDDITDEFKGGTLQINEKSPVKSANDSPENTTLPAIGQGDERNKGNEEGKSVWKRNFLLPLSEITDCIWNKKSISPGDSSKEIQPTVPVLPEENANNFFTFRDGVVSNAVKECTEQLLDSEVDGKLLNVYLLTEIHFWDTDKERLILLTENTVIVIKYDFIALRRVDFSKIFLKDVDSILIGDLVYPKKSLVPRIYGIADGVSSVVQNCFFLQRNQMYNVFPDRSRNMYGIRLMWNKNQPLNFSTKWNPFTNKIPFATFTSHPLLYHKESTDDQKTLFDIRAFIENVCNLLTDLDSKKSSLDSPCIIHHRDILLENYFSVGSIIHNKNALGYFKVRGKFSF